ncbi:MAG: gfo/Idh/MocA family oxidoreductase [Candidatus Zixiibacteriota bacterium]|nr:MAG: gfo/Idh/MocA family oxidoreductase [candidate division Zixibacteria bacterium]
MGIVKTGVVGVGHLGRFHLKWLAQLPQSELVGIYDVDTHKAQKLAAQYGTQVFDSLEDLAEAVEAVSIAVPTTDHFSVAASLIEHGCHCLIEKPVTADLEQADRLNRLADTHDVIVMVGQIERFNPAIRALQTEDVRPTFIEGHRLAAFDPRGTDVAVVLDLMIHDIDLALMLVRSSITDIQASAVAVVSEQADIANARLTFANGAVANLTASRISLKAMRKLRIFQESGYFSLDLARKQADIYSLVTPGETRPGLRVPLGKSGRDILYQKVVDDGLDMLGSELTAFLEAVSGKRPVAVPLSEATEALRVALEIERIGTESSARVLANGN